MNQNAEVHRSVEVNKEMLKTAYKYVVHQNKHYIAESATEIMHFGVEVFWNKHYNLRSGRTRQLALFQGGTGGLEWQIAKRKYKGRKVLEPSPNSRNFRSRNGNKRLVSFTFEKTKTMGNFIEAWLNIHSFPMNLYERDVLLGGWAKGITRKGTHIMRKYLANRVAPVTAKQSQRFQADLDNYCRSL